MTHHSCTTSVIFVSIYPWRQFEQMFLAFFCKNMTVKCSEHTGSHAWKKVFTTLFCGFAELSSWFSGFVWFNKIIPYTKFQFAKVWEGCIMLSHIFLQTTNTPKCSIKRLHLLTRNLVGSADFSIRPNDFTGIYWYPLCLTVFSISSIFKS